MNARDINATKIIPCGLNVRCTTMWLHTAIDTPQMQFLLNIDFDASRNTCYRRLYAAGLRTRSILSARLPSNSPVWTERVSTYVCTGRVSTGLMYAHSTRGVRLLSCRVCPAVGPTSSRLRVISTTLSRCSDLRRRSNGSKIKFLYWKRRSV